MDIVGRYADRVLAFYKRPYSRGWGARAVLRTKRCSVTSPEARVSAPAEIDALRVELQSVPALRGFTMQLAPGEMIGLVGRNGAGKTTLARDHGTCRRAGPILFDGEDLIALPRTPRGARYRLYAGRPAAHAAALGGGKFLLPRWVAVHLDRRPASNSSMASCANGGHARSQGAGAERRPTETGGAWPGAHRRHCLLLDEPFEGVAPALSGGSPKSSACCAARTRVLIAQSDLNHRAS